MSTKTTATTVMGSILFLVVSGVSYWVFTKTPRLFDSIMTGDWPTTESTKYKVEAYGFDIRVYEWTTPSGKVCNTAFTSDGPVGIDCE
jgi:hypothetical protein